MSGHRSVKGSVSDPATSMNFLGKRAMNLDEPILVPVRGPNKLSNGIKYTQIGI